MEAKYFPETDQLCISLSSTPASGGGSQVTEGVWFFYDHEDKVVSVEFEFASDKVNLTDIKNNLSIVMAESTEPISTWTVTELARECGVAPRTIQRIIAKMIQAGKNVGKQLGPTYPIVLYQSDVDAIKQWRENHRSGRPKVETV
ncbi:MAG: hypothetical protein QGG64_20910 [Candidatus Latescibacteria bacterium]|nr:hypothetical protein [Candidatus Latescibacterota bacterium]